VAGGTAQDEARPDALSRAAESSRNLWAVFRLVWSAAPRWTAASLSLLTIQGLLPVVIVYLTRGLVDSLAQAASGGLSWANLQSALLYSALMAAALLGSEALRVLSEWVRAGQAELIHDHVSLVVQNKSTSVDLACYETPDFHDRLSRAHSDAGNRPLALIEGAGNVLRDGITLAGMAAVLLPYGLWIPPALLLSTLPAFYIVLRSSRRYHRWWMATTPDRRLAQYYDQVLTEGSFAPDVRLFDLKDHFQTLFRILRRRLREEHLDLLQKHFAARLAAQTFALLIAGLALLWVGRQVLLGQATLGDVALFYQAFQRGQGVVGSLLGHLGRVYSNSLFLENLFDFLRLKPAVVEPADAASMPAPIQHGISFRGVTFRYPGCNQPVLQNFKFTIPAGKVVAIVGANGSGKSTLLKLLCRFYDPEEGSVQIDGVDIRQLPIQSLRRLITLLPQTPVCYQATAEENIVLGSLASEPDRNAVEDAVRSASAESVIERLPLGYGQLLGKRFPGGVELSGGEWQRIAMARAFLRPAEILALDEPTSMMDSWSEADWLGRLRRLAEGRTAVIITHRLTVAARADIISVMMNGTIVESGSHEELLALNGYYADSWRSQSQPDLAPIV
jgi:ATP-binding cassette subfamily B protein